jgi:hypothetical protein
LFYYSISTSGPEKYREHRFGIWQEGMSLYEEEPGRKMVYLTTKGENYFQLFYAHLHKKSGC